MVSQLIKPLKPVNKSFMISAVSVIFVISVSILFYYYYYIIDDVSEYTSTVDSRIYDIRSIGTDEDKVKAANYLAEVYNKVNYLVVYMHQNKLPNEVVANRLYDRWLGTKLRETNSTDNSVALPDIFPAGNSTFWFCNAC